MKKSTRNALIGVGSLMTTMHLINLMLSGATPLNDALGVASIALLMVCTFVRVTADESNDGPADVR